MGLWSWLAGSCSLIHSIGEFIHNHVPLSRVCEADGQRENFFLNDFNINGIFFFLHSEKIVFMSLFLHPLLSSNWLSSASGQPVSFLEWLPPLRLSEVVKPCAWSMPPHVTGDAHIQLPSIVLLLPDKSTRRQHNKSKCNQLQYTPPPHHPHCNILCQICTIVQWRTHKQKLVQ